MQMRAEQPAADQHGFAAQALLCLQLVTLAAGVLQFAFAPETIERPLLAASALVLLSAGTLVVRMIPVLRRPIGRQHSCDIAISILCITALAAASGAARSALLSLYVIPLTATAVAFGRWWLVALVIAVIGVLGLALEAMTSRTQIGHPQFLVQWVNTFGPGAAVALLVTALIGRMQTAVQRISALAATDALTGLLNLRAFEEILQQEHRKAERSGHSYTLLVIDIDNLAQVNELLGHDAGNQILSSVAGAITRSIRNSDVAARLGGDEFIVLLIEADGARGTAIAQRIRNNVYAGTVSVANRLLRANVNVGVANFPDDHRYPKELMILADQRMQQDRQLRRPPTP